MQRVINQLQGEGNNALPSPLFEELIASNWEVEYEAFTGIWSFIAKTDNYAMVLYIHDSAPNVINVDDYYKRRAMLSLTDEQKAIVSNKVAHFKEQAEKALDREKNPCIITDLYAYYGVKRSDFI